MSAPKPQVLKSIVNEKLHPETIHAHAAVIRSPNGTVSGNWQNKADDETAEYVRAALCAPQDARVQALVDDAIAEDTAANKRVTSRERKQYIRGRIEALKDLRAALRDLEQGKP